jgi:RNA polymerase sigma-70 factor (ECF subfamily)
MSTSSRNPSGAQPGKPSNDIAGLDFSLSLELADFLSAADRAAGALAAHALPADAPDAPFVPSEDSALVLRARTDAEAFGLLYERYVDRIYAYIYHRVGNTQDAEDLTARTFHRALDNLHRYEDRGLPFAAWLFRIAHNLVANWHRDRSRRRFLSLDRIWSHRSDTDDPEDALAVKETHDALWGAINSLPGDRRDLLLYKFSLRLSNVEIGAMMDKSESAIKSLYFRTLASLRTELEARGWSADEILRADANPGDYGSASISGARGSSGTVGSGADFSDAGDQGDA